MAVVEPGRTRSCPHCKATILESADVCPACQHHLRFGADRRATHAAGEPLFRIEGTVRPPASPDPWEYDVVVALYDEKGAEVARKVVHVGALAPNASRRCVVSIDAYPTRVAAVDKPAVAPVARKMPPGFKGRIQ